MFFVLTLLVACFLNQQKIVLDIKPEQENEFYKREAKDMVNIVQRLIAEGE